VFCCFLLLWPCLSSSHRSVFFLHKKSGPAPPLLYSISCPVYYLEAIRHDPLAPGLSASRYRRPAHYTGSLQMSPSPGRRSDGKKSDRLTGSCVKHDRDSAYQRRGTCFYPRSVLHPLASAQNMLLVESVKFTIKPLVLKLLYLDTWLLCLLSWTAAVPWGRSCVPEDLNCCCS